MALVRAAEDVFAERGFAAATVDEIARRAGVPVEAFHLHFDGTEAVLTEIVEGWFARCTALFAPPGEYPDAPSDPDALVDFCIERDVRIYDFLWQTRPTMRIVHGCQGRYDHLFAAFHAEIKRRNRAWLTMWREDGLLRPETNIELAALLMSGAYEELSNAFVRSATRPPIEEWLQFTQETFFRAWGTPELVAAVGRRRGPPSTVVRRQVA